MSNLTANDTRGLMEAYAAVYDQDLREQLEEEREVQELTLQIIENAAYVLFSQGYDVNDVISYFTEATEDVITEDFVNFAGGQLILESVVVSDEYIAEQFELLYERFPGLGFLASQAGKVVNTVKGAVQKSAQVYNRAQNIKNIRQAKADKLAQWKQGSLATPMGPGTSGAPTAAAKAGLLQRATTGAKELLKKVPGAPLVSKLARSPVGKLASKVAPGAGLALGTMDAANRAKRGDYGGATLSGLGAAASTFLPPGLGTAAALGLAGVQAATDAMGLTGDKSKKGPTAKPAPAAPSLKAKQDYAKSKGKYYSSSDQKTYANYNDALAARNSRLGKPAPTPPKTPSTPSSTPSSSTPSTPKPAKPATFTFNNKQVTDAEVNKRYDELKKTDPQKAADFGKNVHSQKYGQPTQGPSSAKIDPKSVEADLKAANDPTKQKPAPPNTALAAEEERRRKVAAEKAAAGTTKESYDAYDIILEYLISGGHVESISEAHYVMLEMDSQTIRNIVEETTTEKLARRASEKADEPGAKSEYKPEGPGFKHPRSKASIMNQIAGRAKNREQHGVDSQYASQSEQPRRGGRKGRGSRTDRPATANMPNPNRRPK